MTFLFEEPPLDGSVSSIPLSELVLQALSSQAYITATSFNVAFRNWLSTLGTLRQGNVYAATFLPIPSAFTSSNGEFIAQSALQYAVEVTAPVLSGIVSKDRTRIYIISGDLERHTVDSDSPRQTTELDLCEIDEGFLENGVLSTVTSQAFCRSFSLTSLASPISVPEEDHTIYLRTRDLSPLGILNGDWTVIRSEKKPSCRLVRVKSSDSISSSQDCLFASPVLCRNITRDDSSFQFSIYPTPFGSSRPSIPTARVVTIARVPSPISVDRTYQQLFLQRLHEHFHQRPRLMQPGDIIALAIDVDVVHWMPSNEDTRDASVDAESTNVEFQPYSSITPNEIVYFVVTNIECDALPSDMHTGDLYAGITTGEWGCWIDSSVTRIVQTGIEHARVPDVAEYLGIDVLPALHSLLSDKVAELVSAALTPNAIEYHLQLSILLKGARGVGKMTTIQNAAKRLGFHVLELNCYDAVGENDTQTEGFLRARFEKAASCSPCLFVLRHVDALSQTTQSSEAGKVPAIAGILSDCIEALQQSWNLTGYPTVVVGTTDRPEETHARVMACFKHEISFDAPEEEDRHSIIRSLMNDVALAPDVSLKDYAVQTAALVASDMVDLVTRGKYAYMRRAMQDSASDPISLHKAGTVLSADDLEVALSKARTSYSESIGAPKIPSVSWDDVGGLANVKADILDTIQLPLAHPELFYQGLKKRSGILLYGPPGTGKTLLAKAVATSCSLNFFSVKGPELLNMYIGESEANVRRVFQRARDAKPCVIFFDELDSVAPKRGAHGDSGGVMDRIVSQLLAELDGVAAGESGADVFVIGATNRPDLLDPALLRPGRFDRMLYLGVSQTHDAQLNILQALTRNFRLHPDLSLQQIAEACPYHYTGADFYALCSDALLKAMSRKAEELEAKIASLNAGPVDPRHPYPLIPQYYLTEMASPEDIDVLVSQQDFESALRNLIPSVSQAEMEHYARVQQQFSKETINSITS